MIRIEPTMWVKRLAVVKSGASAYDETFHVGVNIIRGDNSTGKSTLADLLFFGLGGDVTRWKDEAGSCDTVYVEICANGLPITLRRDISPAGQQPMWIFLGDFDAASSSSSAGWQKYPYRRYGDRESFTQVLFRILNVPEVPGEAGANITMHQLLRLAYVDQMTPVDRIFRFEPNDSPLRRQAIGDLLCGVLDDRIYPAQLALRDKEKEFEIAERQLAGLYSVLDKVESAPSIEMTDAATAKLSADRERLLQELDAAKSRRFDAAADGKGAEEIGQLKAGLDKVNRDIASIQLEVGELELAIEDAASLIDEIERNVGQLREGLTTSQVLGPISFSFCPSCYSPVAEKTDAHVCPLCKQRVDPIADKMRFVRMRNELELQLKESRTLQADRKAKLEGARRKLAVLTTMRDRMASEYLSLVRHYISDADVEIERITRRIGYVDRELVDLQRERRLAEQLQRLSKDKARLNAEISDLRDKIKMWMTARERRQTAAYRLIQTKTAEILSMDLQSEAEFTADTEVYFSFAEDRVAVAGKSGFSASSLTVIRNAFHLALLWASALDQGFKYPRFLLMDNVEDKGMTQSRSQNFQHAIVNISRNIEVEHQIIFTTSMIDPHLDGSDLVVGGRYTFDRKSLNVSSPIRGDRTLL